MATRVSATDSALALIERLTAQYGPVMFYQSGGCCDGTAPQCYPQGEMQLGPHDLWIGEIGGAAFYMSQSHFTYSEHTHLIVDAIPGQGGEFSLDNGTGMGFISRARLYENHELNALPAVRSATS